MGSLYVVQTWFGMGPRLVTGNKKWLCDVDGLCSLLLMFTARNYKVNGTKTCRMYRPCLSYGMLVRFQTRYYFRKEMVVHKDFEKGRSHRLWFKRYTRLKTLPFSGSHVGA